MARVATIQQHELDVLRAAHTGPCYVQLTMRKDGFTQVDADVCNVCPCDLLLVIANAGLIGNCLLLSVKGMSESVGDYSIL